MNIKLVTRQIWSHEWAAIIKDCKASGQKVDIYCKQHGLSRDAYYYWLRKVKEAALKQAGFVELPVLKPEQTPSKTVERGSSAFEIQMIIKSKRLSLHNGYPESLSINAHLIRKNIGERESEMKIYFLLKSRNSGYNIKDNAELYRLYVYGVRIDL